MKNISKNKVSIKVTNQKLGEKCVAIDYQILFFTELFEKIQLYKL